MHVYLQNPSGLYPAFVFVLFTSTAEQTSERSNVLTAYIVESQEFYTMQLIAQVDGEFGKRERLKIKWISRHISVESAIVDTTDYQSRLLLEHARDCVRMSHRFFQLYRALTC